MFENNAIEHKFMVRHEIICVLQFLHRSEIELSLLPRQARGTAFRGRLRLTYMVFLTGLWPSATGTPRAIICPDPPGLAPTLGIRLIEAQHTGIVSMPGVKAHTLYNKCVDSKQTALGQTALVTSPAPGRHMAASRRSS